MKKNLIAVLTTVFILMVVFSTVQAADGKLFLDVDFEGNWFFDTYDVDVYLDNDMIESLQHGTDLSKTIENVSEGAHVISFRSEDDPDVHGEYELEIKGDTTFQCRITCHGSDIDLDKVTIIDNVDLAEITVPDLNGIILSTAKKHWKKLDLSILQARLMMIPFGIKISGLSLSRNQKQLRLLIKIRK